MKAIASVFRRLWNVCLSRLSPELQLYIENTIKKCLDWSFTNFGEFVKKKLLPHLGAMGFVGLSLGAVKNYLEDAQTHFSFFCRLFQIDDLFDLIDTTVATSTNLSTYCNASFIQIAGAFGVIEGVNIVLNSLGIMISISISVWVLNLLVRGLTGLMALVVR